MSGGWVPTPFPQTWDTTGYGWQAGGTHPTGMLSWLIRWIRWSQKVEDDTTRTRSEFENELNENKVQSARKGL